MDLLARPTATPRRLARWLLELARSAPGLVDAYAPGHPVLAPRAREQVVLAVAEVNGGQYAAWVHGAWQDFLGPPTADETIPLLLDFARESARGDRLAETTALDAVLPARAVRAVCATVAIAELGTLAGNSADRLLARVRRPRRLLSPDVAVDAVTVAFALPLAIPLFLTGGLMRLSANLAPPMPPIERPPDPDANLVVHLLADAMPHYLATAAARSLLLALPGPVSIGVRAEGTEATIRLSRSRILLENGLSTDAFLVIDSGVQLLLDVASRTLTKELAALASRGLP